MFYNRSFIQSDHSRPLKKQQSLIALFCKLLRVLFSIGKKQCEFDGLKLLKGLPQLKALQAA